MESKYYSNTSNTKMNIIFFAKYYFPHIGGVEKHAREVAELLVKKGHQVSVFTLKHESKLTDIETKGGVKILRLPYSENKFSIWKNLLQKKHLIKKADIIHCHDVLFWYLPFKLLYFFKKVFVTFHGWEGKYPIPFKYKFIRKINEILASGNICIGDYLPIHYGTKANFISYGGVSFPWDDRPTKMMSKKINQITFIGRLEKDLGLPEYFKALNKIKRKHKLKVTFVGDGSLKKQAKKIGQVTGFVKDIKPYLKTNSFVFASSYLTILEALSIGRPVFALYQNQLKKDYLTKFTGAKYINTSGSADELLNQVTSNLQGESLKALKARKAQKFAKIQTWDKVINIYLKLWK